MKVLKLPTAAGGQWWVVVHGLTLEDGRLRRLRPIHVLTFLGQRLVKNKQRMFELCLALENKLYSVRYQLLELRRAISSVGEIVYQERYVRDYEPDQQLISVLEAYVAAIYSALEIVSRINKILRPQLPQGFRDQSKKFSLFSFERQPWLPRFYDIRSELSHFGTPLPTVRDGTLMMNFTNPKRLEHFSPGKHEIQLLELLSYARGLFDMLDEYARGELPNVDPETDLDSACETGLQTPLQMKKIKAKEILRLVDIEGR